VKGLTLANGNVSGQNLNADVLIGLDFCHSFFTGSLRTELKGPVALETTLGWVLSGKFGSLDEPHHCLQIHAMKAVVEKENNAIKDQLGRFWDIESVGNKETSVIDEFEKHIYQNGPRTMDYVTDGQWTM